MHLNRKSIFFLKFNNINIYFLSKSIAIKRRMAIIFNKGFNPYSDVPKGMSFSPSEFQKEQEKKITPKINFNAINSVNKKIIQSKTRNKIENLIGLNKNLKFKIIKSTKKVYKKNYIRKRIYISLGEKRQLPIDILYKKGLKKGNGIMVCMQGTNSGAHLSLGEIKMPSDPFKVKAGSSLALQAADNNYIAISFDRIGYGERRETKLGKPSVLPVMDISLHSLALGTSLLGETLSEVYSICKWLNKEYKGLPLWCVGYSTAGNVALIAGSLFKDVIKGVCVGGCIGAFKDTILKRGVTAHFEIPHCSKWFDQEIFLQLMAPRPCLVIAGKKDHIWPYSGAKKIIDLARPFFKKFNCSKNLYLIKGEHHHTYYPELMWPAINKYIKL